MADIALTTANRIEVVESIVQMTLPAAEAVTAGMAVRLDTSAGTFTKAKATDATEANVYGIATRTVAAGEALTAIRLGVMDGYVLAGNYGDSVYLSVTDGRLADAGGTVGMAIGSVIPATATTLGTAYDKLLFVDVAAGAGAVAAEVAQSEIVITTDLMAASVAKWIFVANRAYRVTLVEEIHSVVGGSAANVRPRKVTAAGTAAPGDAAGATVIELTTAVVDLTASINVTQTPALSAVAGAITLADGDKLGLLFTGTLTGLVGHLTITLIAV